MKDVSWYNLKQPICYNFRRKKREILGLFLTTRLKINVLNKIKKVNKDKGS